MASKDGILNSAQQCVFCQGLDIKEGSVHIFREYKPRKNSIEYTVYFRRTLDDKKLRVDFEIDTHDLEVLGQSSDARLEPAIVVTARAFARQAIAENRLATQASDGYGYLGDK